ARRSGSTSGVPASSQASRAEMSARRLAGSRRLASTFFSRSSTTAGSTVAAKSTGSSYFSAQSLSRVCAPLVPARAACHVSWAVLPRGVTAPMPVTTTVDVMVWNLVESLSGASAGSGSPTPQSGSRSGLLGLDDVVHSVLDRDEVLHVVVRDLHAELLLCVHDDGHHRDGVDVQVVRERLAGLDLIRLQAGLLVDDLCQTGEDVSFAVCHFLSFSLCPAGRLRRRGGLQET